MTGYIALFCVAAALWWVLWRMETLEGKVATQAERLVRHECRIDELRQRIDELESED